MNNEEVYATLPRIARRRILGKIFINMMLFIFALACILPLIAVVSISFSDEIQLAKMGYSLVPTKWSTLAYQYIFANPNQIIQSYFISTIVTIAGTISGLLICSMVAYAMSRPGFQYKKAVSFYIFFTMLFNGGLVPTYILVARYLHLKDTLWSLILPQLVVPWLILLLRTFMKQIPTALYESAKLDGASEWMMYRCIAVPMSKSALATVGLLISLRFWNDWFSALLYIDKNSLIPLQYMLQRMMANIQFLTTQLQDTPMGYDLSALPNESARMAMCVIAAGPMLFIFPFFQKYFVKGITAGALKE